MTSDVVPPVRRSFSRKRALGGVFVLAMGLGLAWWIWSRPTRVVLTDGRTLVIDRITIGPHHVFYAPFTFQRLWQTVSRRLKSWPNTTYHGQKGTVGVFHHSDRKAQRAHDVLFLVDRDGWWWEAKQKGAVSSGHRLEVFPPIEYPSLPRFEAWNDGALVGGGLLQFTPPVQPIIEQSLRQSPMRVEAGVTSIVLNGIDVVTRDEVRPSEAEGFLKIETLRHGQPAIMRLSDFTLSDALGRGCQCPLDDERRFTTEISPHGPYWYVTFLVWRDMLDPLDADATFVLSPVREAIDDLKADGAEGESVRGDTAKVPPEDSPGLRWSHREVDGVSWRFAIVPPGGTWVDGQRDIGETERPPSVRDAPLLICEREPRKVAALRVEFRRMDGELLYHAIVDGQPDRASGRLQVGCPKLDAAKPYEIRVGVHVPTRVEAVLRPRIMGKAPPKPAVRSTSSEPFPSGFHMDKG